MSNFNGYCSIYNDLTTPNNLHFLENSTKTLNHTLDNSNFFYTNDNFLLGYTDSNNNIKEFIINSNHYIVLLFGNIYNSSEIKSNLLLNGITLDLNSSEEIILKSYLNFGPNIFKDFNGAFSFIIWNEQKKELLLCRDHFGIKPLYYTIINNILIFSSEIKSILSYPSYEPIIDSQGICELFGIGPAHTSGLTAFKNIFELKPANYAIFKENYFKEYEYWKLETKEHIDNFNQTCNNAKYFLEDSIKMQLNTSDDICAMLSGGIDSSIIVAYAAKYLKSNFDKQLKTISVDYLDNDKNFIKSDFQPNSDNYYIKLMKNTFNTDHYEVIIDTPELATSLEDAMLARDIPGMADVDSSMLLFCKNIKQYSNIALSGECSDEIFAGYPWFFREDALNSKTFPWSLAINERQNLLNNEIQKEIYLKNYIDYKYNECINEIQYSSTDSKETKEKRIISYLTIKWFMQTLIDRADKMSNFNELELRVPFCDHRLVQYMWNVPWEMKAYNVREKGLLRYIVKDLLPEEIVNRKKSPYPKTHNPNYLTSVKQKLTNIINKSDSPINNLLDKKYILEILNTNGKSFSRPWFGQLMTGPQLIAYICQVNMWLEKYNPKIIL